jgi:hypothetical protein
MGRPSLIDYPSGDPAVRSAITAYLKRTQSELTRRSGLRRATV